MTDESISQCFGILKAMKSGSEDQWSNGHAQIFGIVLRPLPDDIGRAAVEYAVANCEWRPSPAELRKIAARIASPYPSAEETYAEILIRAKSQGIYGKPVAGRPNIYLEGDPDFSHPLVERVVRMCGGWEMICTGEANLQGSLRRQVEGTHSSVATGWESDVSKALSAGQRSGPLFPKWKPFEIPSDWSEDGPEPAMIESSLEPLPIPAEIRTAIAKIGVWEKTAK